MKERPSIVFLGADHAGFALKESVKRYLKNMGIKYYDFSPKFKEGDDYPDYAFKVAEKVVEFKDSRGILFCGTGAGMAIAANKVDGIRAAEAINPESIKLSREHNDSNVLSIGSWHEKPHVVIPLVSLWLSTPFTKELRHKRRLAKIAKYEKSR